MTPGSRRISQPRAMRNDEFYLDPTRMTLVCGTAAFDGTQFKGLLASEYDIQLNKTSRNSVLLQSNINNTRSDVAHLIRVLVAIARGIEKRLAAGGEAERAAFDARVKSLMTDVVVYRGFEPDRRRRVQRWRRCWSHGSNQRYSRRACLLRH